MEFLIQPWEHQLRAIEKAKALPGYALFFEQGCGKTMTAINILRYRYAVEDRLMRTFILCPVIVVPNWKREFALHSKLPEERIILLQGSQKQRLALMEYGAAKFNGEYVAVTNYEALIMDELFARVVRWRPEILVLDESHKCKDSKSKRTKQAIKLSDLASHKYLLSGTPVLNSPMDLFSQFRILDGGETFSKNFFIFRATYFYDKNAGMPKNVHFPQWEVKPGALEEMNARIFRRGMRVMKKDCLDLPPLVRQRIEVGMTPDQNRMYLQMRDEFITFLNDKACVAQLAITKALRLQQIVSGYVRLEDGQDIHLKDTPRMAALRELLEEITPAHKVLVWAVFKENYAQIRKVCRDLGIEYVEVHGDVSVGDKSRNVDRFNNEPSVRVLIGHPGSGGIGINLVSASYSIFYSRTFSLEYDLQAESRNHRGGSEIHEKITRIDLVTPGTIDDLVLKKLASKEQVGEQLLTDLRKQL